MADPDSPQDEFMELIAKGSGEAVIRFLFRSGGEHGFMTLNGGAPPVHRDLLDRGLVELDGSVMRLTEAGWAEARALNEPQITVSGTMPPPSGELAVRGIPAPLRGNQPTASGARSSLPFPKLGSRISGEPATVAAPITRYSEAEGMSGIAVAETVVGTPAVPTFVTVIGLPADPPAVLFNSDERMAIMQELRSMRDAFAAAPLSGVSKELVSGYVLPGLDMVIDALEGASYLVHSDDTLRDWHMRKLEIAHGVGLVQPATLMENFTASWPAALDYGAKLATIIGALKLVL